MCSPGLARSISVNERLHEVLKGPVVLVVVPIFALANAGVDLRGGVLGAAVASPVMWGVVAGLVVGKLLGISVGAWLAVRTGLGRLPDGVGPGSVAGGAALSGIGFTMSLLIVSLSLSGEHADDATIGVMIAIVGATAAG
ncbi:MAG: Na+/H+ antiporter NhaA [Beutenbergiaceae bacterium]